MDRSAYLHLLRDRRARFHAVLGELGLSIGSDADVRSVVGVGGPSVSTWRTWLPGSGVPPEL
jgi:hypothetical protein